MDKNIKKRKYIGIWILIFLISLPFFIYMLLLDSNIQTYIVNYVSKELQNITHSKVKIEKIEFKPFKTLILKNVYISDDHNDTLFYINKIDANINWINTKESFINLAQVNIDSAKIYLIEDSTKTLNLLRFIDSFGIDTTSVDTSSSSFTLQISKLNINKTSFRIKSYDVEKIDFGLNTDDIFLKSFILNASNFALNGADIAMQINNLSFKDQSGLSVDTLKAKFAMNQNGLLFSKLKLKIDSTIIEADKQNLLFNNFDKFSHFEDSVRFDIDITKSHIYSNDIAWFVPELKTLNVDIKLLGKLNGPLSNLKSSNLKISLTDSTFIETDFTINGLPKIDNTFMYININKLQGYIDDLNNLSLINDSVGNSLIPNYIKTFEYNGNISGFMNNLVNIGTLKTNIGSIYSNILIKQTTNDTLIINGGIKASNINIAKIIDDNIIGKTSFDANINTRISKSGDFYTHLSTNIKHIYINGYLLSNISIKGDANSKYFDGDIVTNDSALDMNFTGHFEYGTPLLNQRFLINIRHANLSKLNLDTDSISKLSCDVMANISGIDPNKISGNVNILDLKLRRNNDSIHINELAINNNQSKTNKNLSLLSDFFNINLKGHYNLTTISHVISKLIAQYAPNIAWDKTDNDSTQLETDFVLSIQMINIQPLIKLFTPDILISNNTSLKTQFNNKEQLLLIEGDCDLIKVAGISLNKVKIRAFNEQDKIHATFGTKSFNYANELALRNISLNTILQKDSVDLNINWSNYDIPETPRYSGNITASIMLNKIDSINNSKYTIKIQPSFFVITDSLWNIEKSQILVDSSSYNFKQFTIQNRYQNLSINGIVSENQNDTIQIITNNIKIEPLNLFTSSMGLNLKGTLNTNIKMTQLYSNPFIGSDIKLDNLTINNQLIGNTKITTNWDPFLEMVHLEWLSTIQDMDALNIVGDYDPINSKLNFRLFIDRFNLHILEPYLKGVLHNLEGLTTTEIILKGKVDKPQISGVVIFDRTKFVLDYTQTQYEITDWFDIAPDAIYFNNLRITDIYDHYGHLNGKITHNNFKSLAIDLQFNSRNLMFLNTLEKDNPTFFGTVFASGNTKIVGPLNNLSVDATMNTDKNTKIFIPLNNSSEVSDVNYIKFKYKDTTKLTNTLTKKVIKKEVENIEEQNSGLSMNLNMNITPDAEIQIIFNSKIGDIIKSKGSADLNISMPANGDITMYGDYIIDNGDYLFTLQDVFQKHLTIAKGSKLSWAGDPAEAIVDIDAIYRVRRVSIYDLTFNQDDQNIAVPVETHLKMSGGLESPTISFGLDLPSSVSDVQEQLNNLPKEEINKQVLSLLIMNRFLPLPGAQSQTKTDNFGVNNNASELLSNQVSNWLSQISSAFDIGFNYTPGDQAQANEYEVAISTQLLNNRVTIHTNVGVGGEQVNTGTQTQSTSNIAGDFEVNIKLDQAGKKMLKAYAKSNEDPYNEAATTQGIGLFYKEDFNTFKELWNKLFGTKIKYNNLKKKK